MMEVGGEAATGEERTRFGTTRTGGWTSEVGGGTAVRTGVGPPTVSWRRERRLAASRHLLATCQPTTGNPSRVAMDPERAGPPTAPRSGTEVWSSEQPSFQDSRAPFSTTWGQYSVTRF